MMKLIAKRFLSTFLVFAVYLTANARQIPLEKPQVVQQIRTEAAFSPGNAENLILKTIDDAKQSIYLAAYSFTSPQMVKALIKAKRRGVDVQVVVDEKGNQSKASISALNILVNTGIPSRTNSHYAIQHDKFIVVDGHTVQTGSFNYSKSASKRNSENVLVVRNNPVLADQYLQHWQTRFEVETPHVLSY